jgi:hypothetical protein
VDDPHRGFHISDFVTTLIEGVTITNGYVVGAPPSGSGGAILAENCNLLLQNCVVWGNYAQSDGGGVKIAGGTEFMDSGGLLDSFVVGNSAGEGGGVSLGVLADTYVRRSVIAGNVAMHGTGGGLLFTDSAAEFMNCTISANRAFGGGGGFASRSDRAAPDFWWCVLWGNCAENDLGDEALIGTTEIMRFYCCAVDSAGVFTSDGAMVDYEDTGVFDDPRFCGPRGCDEAPTDSGDYRVAADSPCLPASSPCGDLIGAAGEGCEGVPVRDVTWGAIKHLFRR